MRRAVLWTSLFFLSTLSHATDAIVSADNEKLNETSAMTAEQLTALFHDTPGSPKFSYQKVVPVRTCQLVVPGPLIATPSRIKPTPQECETHKTMSSDGVVAINLHWIADQRNADKQPIQSGLLECAKDSAKVVRMIFNTPIYTPFLNAQNVKQSKIMIHDKKGLPAEVYQAGFKCGIDIKDGNLVLTIYASSEADCNKNSCSVLDPQKVSNDLNTLRKDWEKKQKAHDELVQAARPDRTQPTQPANASANAAAAVNKKPVNGRPAK